MALSASASRAENATYSGISRNSGNDGTAGTAGEDRPIRWPFGLTRFRLALAPYRGTPKQPVGQRLAPSHFVARLHGLGNLADPEPALFLWRLAAKNQIQQPSQPTGLW